MVDPWQVFRLEVEAAGYAPWVLEGIRVEKTDDECHVETRMITARLTPLP